ncbi:beta strand repeat-containing protein [Methanobrevibacter curvatus]|uniref:Right handed beta helix domain-containing protein n=1 Tax=Methanobrevibacter curvatus TaxID=49547 RepID=A0A166CDD5_9EURY|nr:Ig-like domain repeat protein [Methanobrevibacter curvatus]KZX14390.1 hypothetical protein MBCUR_05090 [Methanobrevibacter curvatus]
MKMKILVISLLLTVMCLSVTAVSAADYNITNENYNKYFDASGRILPGAINDGDVLNIEGTLNNKDLTINQSITINGKSKGKLVNGTIILDNANSGASVIKGLTIENTNKNGIVLNQYASYSLITNNTIKVKGTDAFSGYSLYGIVAYGWTLENNLTDNYIYGSGTVPYFYGIYITPFDAYWSEGDANPQNYIISGNTLKIANDNDYAAGISMDTVLDTIIKNNKIDVKSKKFAYGIISTDSYLYASNLEPAENITISGSDVKIEGSMVYVIESFLGTKLTIDNNNLNGIGDGVYGIATYYTEGANITNNNITTLGGDISSIGYNPDSIASGNAPITLLANSNNILISNNKIKSNTYNIVNTTQAQQVNQSNNTVSYIIDDNSYSSFFDDDGNLLPTSPITTGATIFIANLSNRNIVVDRKLNVYSFDNNNKISNGSIKITEDGSGTLINGLNFISDSNVLIIDSSNDNIIEYNKINILNNYDGSDGGWLSLSGLVVKGDSSRNQILNNNIYLKGADSSNSVYLYAVDLSGSGSNPKDNVISSNTIEVDSGYYGNGISIANLYNTTISNNKLYIKGDSFAYGVYVGDYGSGKTANNQIINNNIKAEGSIVYVIETFSAKNTTVTDNVIFGYGQAVYGYAGYDAVGDLIKDNKIVVVGNDTANTPFNYDALGTGQGGIFYKFSGNTTITGNNIVSIYTQGSDYGIKIINSTNGSKDDIYNNILSSDNGKRLGNTAIYTDVLTETILTATTKAITQGSKAIIKVNLKDKYGISLFNEKIELTINKKTYTATIDSNGIATFSIANLPKGNLTANINYLGNSLYSKSSISKIQVVNPKKFAKISYKYVDKKVGKYIQRIYTIKNTGTKVGSISGTLKIPKSVTYIKTQSKKITYTYVTKSKKLMLKLKDLAPKSTATVTVTVRLKK